MRNLYKKLFPENFSNVHYIIVTCFIAAFAVIGALFLFHVHAASPAVEASATSGKLAGSATSTASASGQYIKFGNVATTGGGGNSLCGFKTGTSTVSKVMVIWEENESDSSIIGNGSLPYMNSLTTQCGFASDYWAYTHPSLPNYMAMTSGANYSGSPWNGDCSPGGSCSTGNTSIFSQMGTSWKSYAETMPSNCDQSNGGPTDGDGNPDYAVRHNPAAYYTNLGSECANQDVSIPTTTYNSGALYSDIQSGLQPFTTVTPNLNDDWHDGSASSADNWLKNWIPVITAGKDYQSGALAICVVFDEGNGSGNVATNTYAVWLSAYTTPGTKSSTFFDDNSVLMTSEQVLGKSVINSHQLDSSGSADNSMVSAFNL